MENISVEEADSLIEYYKSQIIKQGFENDSVQSGIFNVSVKNEADVVKCAKGAEYAFNAQGELLLSFEGIVTTEDGTQSASFKYVGENEAYGDLVDEDEE